VVQRVSGQRGQGRALDTDPLGDAVWHRVMEETSVGTLHVLFGLLKERGVCSEEFRTWKKTVWWQVPLTDPVLGPGPAAEGRRVREDVPPPPGGKERGSFSYRRQPAAQAAGGQPGEIPRSERPVVCPPRLKSAPWQAGGMHCCTPWLGRHASTGSDPLRCRLDIKVL